MSSITSANSVLTLMAAGLFPVPVQIQGFSSDRAFMTEAVDIAEVRMGVDGELSAGYIPNPVVQTISLQADSPSRDFFTTIIQASKTARDVYYLTGTVTLPGTGESFSLIRGVLTQAKQMPDAQKVLEPVDYVITWKSVDRSLL